MSISDESGVDFHGLVEGATRQEPIRAVEIVEVMRTASTPHKMLCDDGGLYAVKFSSNRDGNGRAVFAENVVSGLGLLLAAPVAEAKVVEVPGGLLRLFEELPEWVPKIDDLHHGSRWIANCGQVGGIKYEEANHERFAALEVLYTWLYCGSDHQLIYEDYKPHHVHSVDHSHFFPRSYRWSVSELRARTGMVERDGFFARVRSKRAEAVKSLQLLEALTPQDIASVVGRPPQEWGVPVEERASLAEYLYARQRRVLDLWAEA